MARMYSFAVLGGVALFAAWGVKLQHEHAQAARGETIAAFKLDDQQGQMYDVCLDALRDKVLRNGGAKETFCGCFASAAMQDADDRKFAPAVLKEIVSIATQGPQSANLRADQANGPGYMATFFKGATAFKQCAEAQRNKFESLAALKSWCAEKPERASDYRCKVR